MTFAGTTQKCMACNKTVYLVDRLTADNRVYHKACFRCHHCRGTLKKLKEMLMCCLDEEKVYPSAYSRFLVHNPYLISQCFNHHQNPLSTAPYSLQLSNYNSFEGVPYCRPHFDQLFKRTGSLDKSFEGTPKILKPEKPTDKENSAANKVSTLFAGTREKCVGCTKTVYPIEKVTVNGTPYHKSCFKCTHGGCVISPSNYIAHEGRLYCKHHHIQLFKEKGNYSQLETDPEKDLMTGKVAQWKSLLNHNPFP